jgi:FAD binding domain-containing protein
VGADEMDSQVRRMVFGDELTARYSGRSGFVPRGEDLMYILIGDAAHATSPHVGQGAAQAIGDATEVDRPGTVARITDAGAAPL